MDPTAVQPPAGLARLVMVTATNNNKYYEMEALENGVFSVSFGRVGGSAQVRSYPMDQWDRKYREKIRKGYVDVTALVAEPAAPAALAEIDDPQVARLMQRLMRYANQSIQANYTVAADAVTPQQVAEAQALLDGLVALLATDFSPEAFNAQLLSLYTIIPRRMAQVQDHLVTEALTPERVATLQTQLAEEQATLDVMAGQVQLRAQHLAQQDPSQAPQNLLDTLGIALTPVTDPATLARIRGLMGKQEHRFVRAFAVTNHRSQRAFDAHVQAQRSRRTELFWHGSRNQNWLSILESGLVLRPAKAIITGKMFGYGLYFADRFQKSLGYTSLRGACWTGGGAARAFLGLFDVHLGHALHIRKHQPWCCRLDAARLAARQRGWFQAPYDSVFAEGGVDLRNNEYIIYQQAQCTIRYLVEVMA